MINKEPSYIVYDEETSPANGWFFGNIYETNIVRTDQYETIICISWWDSDSKKLRSIAQWDFPDWKKGVWNDKSLVKYFREIIIKYDIVAGQNSDEFDNKMLNARLAYWGFDPIPDCKTLDTKKIAKSKLKLPSYSLEFMLGYFNLGNKYHHSGLDMWFGSRDGNRKDQKEMIYYCKNDTLKTKNLLLKILPFIKQSNDFIRIKENKDIGIVCSNPLCLSKNLVKAKKRRVKNGYKQQYQCNDCGGYTQHDKLIK